MITFRKFLHESETKFITDRKEVEKWIVNNLGLGKFSIRIDGTIDTIEKVEMSVYGEKHLPVKFGETGPFFLAMTDRTLTTLEGLPRKVNGYLTVSASSNGSLANAPLKFLPLEVAGKVTLQGFNNLEGIGEMKLTGQSSIAKVLALDGRINRGSLGILSTGAITILQYESKQLQPPLEIIAHYLSRGAEGIFDCQQELIEAGYEEYAQL